MPTSDAFFIRATVRIDAADTYKQTEIPLGPFIDVLGNTVLRVLNVEGEFTQGSAGPTPGTPVKMDADEAGYATLQISTQSQVSMLGLDDKQLMAKGQMSARNPDSAVAGSRPTQVYSDSHLPQHYSEGYLIATESLFLGGQRGDEWILADDMVFNVVLECQTETLSAKKGMALALSQQ